MEKETNERRNKETINADEKIMLDISSIDKDVRDAATILSSMAELNPQTEEIIYGNKNKKPKRLFVPSIKLK